MIVKMQQRTVLKEAKEKVFSYSCLICFEVGDSLNLNRLSQGLALFVVSEREVLYEARWPCLVAWTSYWWLVAAGATDRTCPRPAWYLEKEE